MPMFQTTTATKNNTSSFPISCAIWYIPVVVYKNFFLKGAGIMQKAQTICVSDFWKGGDGEWMQ